MIYIYEYVYEYICIYNWKLSNYKKEGNLDICNNIDENGGE